jgi:hypothetical protein
MRLAGMATIVSLSLALGGFASVASADPWKDESGKGRSRGGYERHDEGVDRWKEKRRYRGYRAAVKIPRGHLPPPGECRTWYPDLPPGHQPPPYRC